MMHVTYAIMFDDIFVASDKMYNAGYVFLEVAKGSWM